MKKKIIALALATIMTISYTMNVFAESLGPVSGTGYFNTTQKVSVNATGETYSDTIDNRPYTHTSADISTTISTSATSYTYIKSGVRYAESVRGSSAVYGDYSYGGEVAVNSSNTTSAKAVYKPTTSIAVDSHRVIEHIEVVGAARLSSGTSSVVARAYLK